MEKPTYIAVLILILMFSLMLGSVWNDSAIMDELAHVPAGFGYITQFDYRLNPEHPPLIKVLSALSAWLAVRPHFPTDTQYWRDDINGQWAQGAVFLYESGNNADRILFWSRLPLILLSSLLGWLIYRWMRKRFGAATALLTLTIFAFSPTVLAHSRYVTTDLGATLGFFIGITSFIAFLERPRWRTITVAGLLLGIALLLKFSAILLIPIYALMLFAWIFTKPHLHIHERARLLLRLGAKAALIGIIGVVLIWIVYGALVWNYPQHRQLRDAEFLLGSYGSRAAVNIDLALIRNPLARPLGEYLLGFLMVQQRAAGGNTTFFLGETSAAGSRLYFPAMYLFKESLALHILTLIALGFSLQKMVKSRLRSGADKLNLSADTRGRGSLRTWIWNHFPEFSAFVCIAIYWMVSMRSPLNIGVRHVLPTFPFIYLLISRQIISWLHTHQIVDPANFTGLLKNIYQIYIKALPRYLILAVLLIWMVAANISTFPHFMSYYNELAGGTANGWRIAVDSNYDWGQDMKRLTKFVDTNRIEKIALDYFGGASPRHYLGDRFEPWWSSRGPAHGWFAISASTRQGAFGTPTAGFMRKPEDSYEWLKPYEPVARIGYSIFVYQLP